MPETPYNSQKVERLEQECLEKLRDQGKISEKKLRSQINNEEDYNWSDETVKSAVRHVRRKLEEDNQITIDRQPSEQYATVEVYWIEP